MRPNAAHILLLTTLLGTPAAAQNLVINGTFDFGLAGWTSAPGTAEWTSQDASGGPDSGSVLVTKADPASGEVTLSRCVTVEGGLTYNFGAKAKVASGQSSTGEAKIRVAPYSTASCSGQYLLLRTSSGVTGGGEWSPVVGGVEAPASTRSMLVFVVLLKNGTTGQFQASFDDVWLSPSAPTTLTIPSAASIHGKAGAFFHSDLWVLNHSSFFTQTITARYRCFVGQSCPSGTKSFQLEPRRSIQYSDVVGPGLFAAPETAGAIELTYDKGLGEVSVGSRVYTPSLPAPTNGTSVPALTSEEARTRTLFLGLGSNRGDLTSGFRSNAGAYNPSGSSASVTFTIYNGITGRVLGDPMTRTWAAYEAYQLNDVFAALGAGNAVTTNAYLVVTSSVPVFAFVTVIDNVSGDSVWVNGAADTP